LARKKAGTSVEKAVENVDNFLKNRNGCGVMSRLKRVRFFSPGEGKGELFSFLLHEKAGEYNN